MWNSLLILKRLGPLICKPSKTLSCSIDEISDNIVQFIPSCDVAMNMLHAPLN